MRREGISRFAGLANPTGHVPVNSPCPGYQVLAPQRFVNAADWVWIFRLDDENIKGTMFRICSSELWFLEASMLKIFVEEAAALASLTLFVGMIAVWAQLFTQF